MCPFIDIAGRSVSTYSLMAAAGIIAAMIFIFVRCSKDGIEYYETALFFMMEIIFGAAGAWLLYAVITLFQNPDYTGFLFNSPSKFISHVGAGYVFYGGLFGVLGGMALIRKLLPLDGEKIAALSVPAIPLFHAFGRIGCFLAGCCYGINIGGEVVPVQLYEASGNIVIFVVLIAVGRKNKELYRQLGLYMALYGIMRFILEFFRGDRIRGYIGVLSVSQWISIIIVIPVGLILLIKSRKNRN